LQRDPHRLSRLGVPDLFSVKQNDPLDPGHRTFEVGAGTFSAASAGTTGDDGASRVMHLGDLMVRQGFDGQTAWIDTPMTGKQILSGRAADMMRQQARFYGPLDPPTTDKEIAVTGFANFDDRDCVELKLVGQGGATSFLYVDAETGLTAGTRFTVETPLGLIETKNFSREYRDFDGFRTPTEIYVESSVQRQVIRIETVTFEEIPASEFGPPPGAKPM
jgi:hypothetical protein